MPPTTSSPLWSIGRGRPGSSPSKTPRPAFRVGDVLRTTLWDAEHPVPDDAPGLRRVTAEKASAIVTVVEVGTPSYSYDEDGNQPHPDLIGVDGWYFPAQVRIATVQEAARILAVEAAEATDEDLTVRCRRLLSWAGAGPLGQDAVLPPAAEVDLGGTVPVPMPPQGGAQTRKILVDEPAGLVWTVASYHDDYADTNWRGAWAVRQPLTGPRRELLAALRARYGADQVMRKAGISREAAVALLAAGWNHERAGQQMGALRLDTAADVAEVMEHLDVLDAAGWLVAPEFPERRWPVGEAVMLARGGVQLSRARSLAQAGVAVADMAATTPPAIDPQATRIIVDTDMSRPWVFSSAGEAARIIGYNAQWWGAGAVTVEVGPTCVHGDGAHSWSLWSDGTLLLGHIAGNTMPKSLPRPAVEALRLVAHSHSNSPVRNRAAWEPVTRAIGHTTTNAEYEAGWDHEKALIRHDFTVGDGQRVTWWQVESNRVGEEADAVLDVTDSEADARQRYRRVQV